VQRGDRVKDVLGYVEYYEEDLLRGLRRTVEDALDVGRISYEESAQFWARYEAGLRGYTYLSRGVSPAPQHTPPTEAPLADREG
jgi:arginine decarboxylase